MKRNVLDQLRKLKASDKFPAKAWSERGVTPSPEDVQEKMNQEVNAFIEFVERRLKYATASMAGEIQAYMKTWDTAAFDNEETEFMAEIMCEVMRMVDVDSDKILI